MENQDGKKHGIYELSQDRQVIEARILKTFRERKTDYDYTLPYSELNELVGGDVQRDTNLSSKVTGACRAVSIELGISLKRDPVRGGVIVLPPEQYSSYGDRVAKSVRRKAKRGAVELGRMSTHAGLPQEDRQRLHGIASVLGAAALFSGKRSVDRIADHVKQSDGPLSVNRTLEAFKKA